MKTKRTKGLLAVALGSALIFLGLLSGCTASAQRHAEVLGAPAPCGQDDTAALQQALDRVSNGGVLVLGAGEYHVDGALCVPEKATLRAVQGALLCVGKEGSLTVNGRVQAGIYPIFAVEGQLQGSSPSTAYPQWFGAKGDGTTDDSRALEQAVRCFATVKLPETGDGGYVLGDVRLEKAVTVEGVGNSRITVLPAKGCEAVFCVAGSGISVKNFVINGASMKKDSTAFLMDSQRGDMSDISIENIHATALWGFLKDNGGEHSVTRFDCHSIQTTDYRGGQFYMTRFTEGITMSEIVVSAFANVYFPGIWVENANGWNLQDMDVAGGRLSGEGGHGMVFVNSKNVVLERAMMEFISGKGLWLKNCSGFSVGSWVSSPYQQEAILLEQVTDSRFDLLNIVGEYELNPIEGATADCLVLRDCSNCEFVNVNINRCYFQSLVLENCTDMRFKTLLIENNFGNGILEKGTSDRNIFEGVTISNIESDAEVVLVGENSEIRGLSTDELGFCQRYTKQGAEQ
ncbi:MAG: right-handed parallel beta-helix repeat-containing protein [Clostridia bacterium]|nr:right-handed parallel beta-helix repeat-containing protein [Clostridia bacterium]